jgi:hypothetical protein
MKWFHIRDKQPLDGEDIIQVDPPYEGHYCMGMRKYSQGCSWEEILRCNEQYGLALPNFWWMSAKDFPFPDSDKIECSNFFSSETHKDLMRKEIEMIEKIKKSREPKC